MLNYFLILTQRLSVLNISILLPFIFMYVIYSFFKKNIKISIKTSVVFLLLIASEIISYLYNIKTASISSLSLFVVLYSLFIFNFKDKISSSKFMVSYNKIMFFIAFISIVLFFSQGIIGNTFLIMDDIIQSDFLIGGYNTTYETSYGNGIYKNNGLFFLEPSFFSQFLALAIMIETLYLKNKKRMVVYYVAIFTSYSGTGILMLLVFYFYLLNKLNLGKKLLLLLFLFFISVIIYSVLPEMFSRIFEIQSSGSSAFIRFVSPFIYMTEFLNNANLTNILLGLGSGNADNLSLYTKNIHFETNFFTLSKLIIEYGFIGTIFFVLFLYTLLRKNMNIIIFVLLFKYMLLSGALLEIQTVLFIFFITKLIKW